MADSNLRSNPVNVEQIMEQIRGRIRDQHGVEYTEQQLQDLAAAQLEKFLDPRKVRSNLLEEFRRLRAAGLAAHTAQEAPDDAAVFQTDSAPLRLLRTVLRPITRLFINTRALATVLLQSQSEASRRTRDQLLFELTHNLVVETARLNIELKSLRMRNESLAGRVEFNERRVRTLEGAVVYQPARVDAVPERAASVSTGGSSSTPSAHADSTQEPMRQPTQPPGTPGDGQRRRRRRRRGRRGGAGPSPQFPQGTASSPATPDTTDNAHPDRRPAESASEIAYDEGSDPESNDGGSDIEPQ